MNTYIYQAAHICKPCVEEIKKQIDVKNDLGDSEYYPQGPYSDGGGEADYPVHCDCCDRFLENPLTDDGVTYLKELIENGTVYEADYRECYSYVFDETL